MSAVEKQSLILYNTDMAKKRIRRKKFKYKKEMIIIIVTAFVMTLLIMTISAYRNSQMREEEMKLINSPLFEHHYNWDYLKENGSFMSYEDDSYTSVQGIDVSSHQEVIDWKKVKEAGVEFAFIRVGYRGYYYGELHEDEQFWANYNGAKENGIKVGVYFFSQAVSPDEAREEADFVLNRIGVTDIDLPVVFDLEEDVDGNEGRVKPLSQEEKTTCAVTFMRHIRNSGYDAMIYNSSRLYEQMYIIEYLQEFQIWVADYTGRPQYDYRFSIWQYTSEGEVDGINGDTDMDIMFVEKR